MAKSKQTSRSRRAGRPAEEREPRAQRATVESEDLEELDAFIEKVLEEAGEEFLDEFRQIEGE